VTRSLAVENWTAIREIGVQYDAALVVTTNRGYAASVARRRHLQPLERLADQPCAHHAAEGRKPALAGRDDFCRRRSAGAGRALRQLRRVHADTYFTAFHYDARALRLGNPLDARGQGVPVWSANGPPGVD